MTASTSRPSAGNERSGAGTAGDGSITAHAGISSHAGVCASDPLQPSALHLSVQEIAMPVKQTGAAAGHGPPVSKQHAASRARDARVGGQSNGREYDRDGADQSRLQHCR